MDRHFESNRGITESIFRSIFRTIKLSAQPLLRSLMAGFIFLEGGCSFIDQQTKEGVVLNKGIAFEQEVDMSEIDINSPSTFPARPKEYRLILDECLELAVGPVILRGCHDLDVQVNEDQFNEAEYGRWIKVTPIKD